MEISINYVVTIILAIVMFIAALAFAYNIFDIAIDIHEEQRKEAQDQINILLGQGQKVAIPQNKLTTQLGESRIFDVGVQNMAGANKNFTFTLKFRTAYDKEEERIVDYDGNYIDQNWNLHSVPTNKSINNHERRMMVFLIKPDNFMKSGVITLPGTYVFDLNISVNKKPYGTSPYQLYLVVSD